MKTNLGPLILLVFLLVGCASIDDYQINQDKSGVARLRHKEGDGPNLNGFAIRKKDRSLITEKLEAEKVLASYKDFSTLRDDVAQKCNSNNFFSSSRNYHRALHLIKKQKYQLGLEQLELMKKHCRDIDLLSNYHYLKGHIFLKLGKMKQARKSLKDFLNFSEYVVPMEFYQGEEWQKHDQHLTKERQAAKDFLEQKSDQLPLYRHFKQYNDLARMNYFGGHLPGGQATRFMPWLSLNSNPFESSLFLGVDIPTNYMSITPAYKYGFESGGVGAVMLRKTLYTSPVRDWMVGIHASVMQWKKIRYEGERYGNIILDVKAEVKDKGFDYMIGTAATKRFLPGLGLAGQGDLIINTATEKTSLDPIGSLFGFYDLTPEVGFFAGLKNNNLAAGIHISSLSTYYDFDRKIYFLTFGGFLL